MSSLPARTHRAPSASLMKHGGWLADLPVVPLAVVGSLLVHVGAFAATRAIPEGGPVAEPAEAMVAFEVSEPVEAPEPEPPPVEPEPETPARALVRPEPEPREAPEPPPEPTPEPREALANADPDASEAPADAPLEQEAAPDHMTGHGIASSEGGLAVAARAGDGSGLRGGRRFERGAPVPQKPAIDYQALANQWMRKVNRIINKQAGRSYPLAAKRERLQGVARLAVFVDASGRITSVRIARSSGHDVLDEAALATVQDLGRVPPPPEELRWQGQHPVQLPVGYRLR